MGERIAQLAALVDRTGRLGREVARDTAGIREAAEERLQSGLIVGDLGVALAVGAIEEALGSPRRAAVAGAMRKMAFCW